MQQIRTHVCLCWCFIIVFVRLCDMILVAIKYFTQNDFLSKKSRKLKIVVFKKTDTVTRPHHIEKNKHLSFLKQIHSA